MKDKIIIIVGPTASGKTDMGVRLAKKLNGEIISADSMQIYKKMDIGTAKPTIQEMDGIPHYLVDEIEPSQAFSVALFRERSEEYIQDILSRGKRPLVVGGTGLYINSLTKPWSFSKTEPNHELRLELENVARERGNEYLHELLSQIDPFSAKFIHPNNVKRVIRAIEVFKTTGTTKSQMDLESTLDEVKYDPLLIGLYMDRSTLYSRIERRIDLMLERGLVSEVANLLTLGYDETLVSMQGLGYKEVVKYLRGEYTLDQCVEILKRDTRHFAKRQMTWFNRDDRIQWFDMEDSRGLNLLESEILNYLNNKGIN